MCIYVLICICVFVHDGVGGVGCVTDIIHMWKPGELVGVSFLLLLYGSGELNSGH